MPITLDPLGKLPHGYLEAAVLAVVIVHIPAIDKNVHTAVTVRLDLHTEHIRLALYARELGCRYTHGVRVVALDTQRQIALVPRGRPWWHDEPNTELPAEEPQVDGVPADDDTSEGGGDQHIGRVLGWRAM